MMASAWSISTVSGEDMADSSRAIQEGRKFRVSIQSRQRHFDGASKDAEIHRVPF
jgi:hypothetical protein